MRKQWIRFERLLRSRKGALRVYAFADPEGPAVAAVKKLLVSNDRLVVTPLGPDRPAELMEKPAVHTDGLDLFMERF